MALIKCPECAAKISPKAHACPKCGHPISHESAGSASAGAEKAPFFALFFDVLTHPREVFGGILKGPRSLYTWPMLLLWNLISALSKTIETSLFDGILSFILGVPISFLALWIMAILDYFVGRTLGGTGKPTELFDGCVWLCPLMAFSEFFKVIQLLVDSSDMDRYLYLPIIAINLWGYALGILFVAMAHRFSIAKSSAVFVITSSVFVLGMYLYGLTWQKIAAIFMGIY